MNASFLLSGCRNIRFTVTNIKTKQVNNQHVFQRISISIIFCSSNRQMRPLGPHGDDKDALPMGWTDLLAGLESPWGWHFVSPMGWTDLMARFATPWGWQNCVTHGDDNILVAFRSPWGRQHFVYPMGLGAGVMCPPHGRWQPTC